MQTIESISLKLHPLEEKENTWMLPAAVSMRKTASHSPNPGSLCHQRTYEQSSILDQGQTLLKRFDVRMMPRQDCFVKSSVSIKKLCGVQDVVCIQERKHTLDNQKNRKSNRPGTVYVVLMEGK